MPRTRTQKIVFSLLMALIMVYGMETYNHLITNGLTAGSFSISLAELAVLLMVVILLEEFLAGRLARKIAFRFVNPEKSRRIAVILAVQVATVFLMCPMMSFVATLVFKQNIYAPLIIKWLKTFAANFPMAMFWQLLVAGPVVRKITGLIKS